MQHLYGVANATTNNLLHESVKSRVEHKRMKQLTVTILHLIIKEGRD